jgi:hypothetical protein
MLPTPPPFFLLLVYHHNRLSLKVIFFNKGLIYDLGDCTKWEYLLPSNEKPLLSVPNRINENEDVNDDDADEVRLTISLFCL